MADGLSLAANIIAVVQLAGEIAFLSYKYINGVKRASEGLQKFDRELKSFKYVLLKLQTFVDKNPGLADSWDLVTQLKKCRDDMATIKLGLKPKKKNFGLQLLWCQWPFKEKETLDFIERVERLKSLFDLAMGDFQCSQLRKIGKDVHALQVAQVPYGSRNIEDQTQQDIPDMELVIKWLYPEASDKRHAEISGRRQPNTGKWILEEREVQDWGNGVSKSRLLWGYGIPGAGKTFLSSLMIDHLRDRSSKQSKHGVAYIYFNYSEQTQQTPSLVLASLTKQLACQIQELPEEINECYKKITKKQESISLEERYSMLLIIVKAFAPGSVFLVCDALDECKQDTQRKVLLPLFHRMARDGMNLFITSRDFPDDIKTSFNNLPKIKLWAKDEDIKFYTEQKIAGDSCASRLVKSGNCQDEIVSQLKECSNGMFLMVSFHVKYLCQQVNLKQLLVALKELKENSTSKRESPMDTTYDRVMETIKSQAESRLVLALNILSWLANAQCVLTVRQLQMAVSIESDCTTFDPSALPHRNTLLDVCAGLITIDQVDDDVEDDLEDTIRLAHYTIQEYLLRKSILSNDGDMQIATACVKFTSYDNFAQGACISNNSDKFQLYLHPFLRYVAGHMVTHIRRCDEISTTKLVLEFLKTSQSLPTYVEGRRGCQRWTALHFTATLGHATAAEVLLEQGADISAVDSAGCTALHHARTSNTFISLLIEKGADITAVDSDGRTALHLAAIDGHEPVVKLLLEKGADITAVDSDGVTVLHLAVFGGHEPVVKILLENGADTTAADSDGVTVLHLAVFGGHESVVKLLLEKGADITAVGKDDGRTALHLAAARGHEPVVKLLLETGADITAVGKNDGRTVLHLAAIFGHEPVVKLLLEKGADITAVGKNDGRTVLHLAAILGHEPVVKLLLEKGADITTVDSDGRTALHLAAARGHEPVVKLLLEKGADITAVGSDGMTALHLAVLGGHEPVVKLLLEKGADITAMAKNDGSTALHLAVFGGNEPVVKLLLENGADITAVRSNGRTALHLAAIDGHEPVVKLLLEKGADITAVENEGSTALHFAAFLRHEPVVKLLLEKGTDITTGVGKVSPVGIADLSGSKHMENMRTNSLIAVMCEKTSSEDSPQTEQLQQL